VDAVTAGFWYDDLCSCLQVDVAAVLRTHGWDPVRAMGAHWRFAFTPGTCEPVEFFLPAGAVLIDDPLVHVEWHRPADAAVAAAELRQEIDAGRPPIVAVDNYYLPFRPAYRDVHAAHLMVVTGCGREMVEVLDPMPPAYSGPLPARVLDASRSSVTVTDPTDPFFAGSALGWRWLSVYPTGPQPTLTWEWFSGVVRANLAVFVARGRSRPPPGSAGRGG